MTDVNCPYCATGQEINHDDGHGYDEDREHDQHCTSCGKLFKFTTSIMYSYEVLCNDEHDMEEGATIEGATIWDCTRCDHYEVIRGNSRD